MKVALVHDFLREYGGAERVVEALHEIWPDAPLYTSFVDWKSLGRHAERFGGWDIRTSWVQDNWLMRKFHSPLRFLAPHVWESFDLSEFDVVLTSSGWFIDRGVKAGRRKREIYDLRFTIYDKNKKNFPMQICYIHHPPRNLYGYPTGSTIQKYWPVKVYSTIINFFLRHYDYQTAQRVDYFIANSKETARRVEKFYRRESEVIYPPIEMPDLRDTIYDLRKNTKKSYYLSVGRLAWAKRTDLIIHAANKLKLPLKIVGKGKEEAYLRSIAGPTVEFVGGVSDSELAELYAGAKTLIFCALDEDFGMVPVESMAHGTPVIALSQGGVKETVIHKRTGLLFEKPTVEALVTTIQQFNKTTIRPSDCVAQAKKFSKERFKKELREFVEKKYRLSTE